MSRARSVRAVAIATALFVAAFIAWVTVLHTIAPRGTLAAQIVILLGGYVFLLAIGLMWAHRRPRLARHGYEGWATILAVHPLQPRELTGELTDIKLRLVVPGAVPYAGHIVRMLAPHERALFLPGETFPIRVDPRDRDHVLLQPHLMPH